MRRILIAFFALLLVLESCCNVCPDPRPCKNEMLTFDVNPELSAIIWDFTTQLKYEKRLRLEHSRVAVSPAGSTLTLQFTTQSILEMWQGRHLLVDIVEGLLDRINATVVAEELGPYPVTADSLIIDIKFESFYGQYMDPFYLGYIKLVDGMAYYYAFTAFNPFLEREKDEKWNSFYEAYYQSKLFTDLQREAEKKYHVEHPIHSEEALKEMRFHPKQREL